MAKKAGFTLVELMVTIAIIGILAAVGVPMYSSYVTKARSADGQTILSSIKAKQELYRSTRFTYAANLSDLPGFDADTLDHGDYFQVTIVSGDANTFVVRAWDGQKSLGGEEWYITHDLDEPCHTKSSWDDVTHDNPCAAIVEAALGE